MRSLVNDVNSPLDIIDFLIVVINFFLVEIIFVFKFILKGFKKIGYFNEEFLTISLFNSITCSLSSFWRMFVTSIFSSLKILMISSLIFAGCIFSESTFSVSNCKKNSILSNLCLPDSNSCLPLSFEYSFYI